MIFIFLANSIISSISMIIYEKKYLAYKNERKTLLTPKCNGAST
jgi:hypothetical protein